MMTPGNEKIVGTRHHLIVTCKAGQEGFHKDSHDHIRTLKKTQQFPA